VRQIYRGPEFDESQDEYVAAEPTQYSVPARIAESAQASPATTRNNPMVDPYGVAPAAWAAGTTPAETVRPEAPISAAPSQVPGWPFSTGERVEDFNARPAPRTSQISVPSSYTGQGQAGQRGSDVPRITTPTLPRGGYPYAKVSAGDSGRGRRAQDDLGYKPASSYPEPTRRPSSQALKVTSSAAQRVPYAADPAAPAWLYAPQAPASQSPVMQNPPVQPKQGSSGFSSGSSHVQSSVADTLQHSRERVAARW
jgi:hypothetical protein